MALLTVCENKAYTECIHGVSNLDTQVRVRLELDENNTLFTAHACAKKPYGQFENVMLTEEEYEALKKKIPDAEQRIEIFSCKLKAKGYRYEDHFATILLWFAEEKNQSKTAKGSFDIDDFFEAALRRTYGEGEADAGAR